jgi:hypothetical protein
MLMPDGRQITPTQFLESINAINELLISAHSLRHSFLDNMLAVFSLQLSKLILTSHYEKANPGSSLSKHARSAELVVSRKCNASNTWLMTSIPGYTIQLGLTFCGLGTWHSYSYVPDFMCHVSSTNDFPLVMYRSSCLSA